MPRDTISATTPAGSTVVCWPEPSPLHDWWTEIMDGVTPIRARGTGEHAYPRPAPFPCRRPA